MRRKKNQAESAKSRDEQRLKAENAKKPKQKKTRKKRSVPKTVQNRVGIRYFVCMRSRRRSFSDTAPS